MNKKTFLLITILLAVPAAYFLLQKDVDTNTELSPEHYSIKNLEQIDKIFISENNTKDFALLTKDNNNVWRVNKNWVVNESRMRILLETIRDIRVKYEVDPSTQKAILGRIAASGVKTMIYSGDKLLKAYFIGTPTSNMLGTYIAEQGSTRPAVVHIPGMNGFVSSRYFTDSIEWRNKNIFNIPSENIAELRVEWPENLNDNFTIENTGSEVKLLGPGGQEAKGYNKLKTKSFLKLFMVYEKNNLSCEGFHKRFSKEKVDSIAKQTPYFIVSLKQKNGTTKELKLYKKPIQVNTYDAYNDQGELMEYEIDKYWGIQDDEDMVMEIQDLVFSRIMKTNRDFE